MPFPEALCILGFLVFLASVLALAHPIGRLTHRRGRARLRRDADPARAAALTVLQAALSRRRDWKRR